MRKYNYFPETLCVTLGLLLSVLLVSCSSNFNYQDEPQVYSSQDNSPAISYLSLAFSNENDVELALQIALVKYKHDAIEQERWLLRHQIVYQWILVEHNREVLHLLVAGPYEAGPQLAQKRKLLQQGLGYSQAMPVMALGLASQER
jgi:hypothetical protein